MGTEYTEGMKGHMAPMTNHIFLGGFRSEKVFPVHFQYGHVDVDVDDDKDEDKDEHDEDDDDDRDDADGNDDRTVIVILIN